MDKQAIQPPQLKNQLSSNSNPENQLFQINADLILKEFVCTICLGQIEDCHITKCGHCFCKECILEAINRHHRCPFCQNALQEQDVFRNYHFINIKKVVMDEKERATKAYIDDVFDNIAKDEINQHKEISPIQQLFKKYLKSTIMLYQKTYDDAENDFTQRQLKLTKQHEKRIQELYSQKNIDDVEMKKQNDVIDICFKQDATELDNQLKQLKQFYLESLEHHLEKIIPSPDMLEVRVQMRIPQKNIWIENILIKPNSFIGNFRTNLEEYFQKNNDQIITFEPKEVALILIQLQKIKEYSDLICQNKHLSYEGLNLLIEQLKDQDIAIKPMSSNELFAQLKIVPGSQLIIIGNFTTKSDQPPECMTYNFQKDMVVNYYSCENCKLNWICESCKNNCHKSHTTSVYLQSQQPTWACCYCVTKGQCKILNKNSKKLQK